MQKPLMEQIKEEQKAAQPKKQQSLHKRHCCDLCGEDFRIFDVPQTLMCNHKAHLNCVKLLVKPEGAMDKSQMGKENQNSNNKNLKSQPSLISTKTNFQPLTCNNCKS